MIRKWAGSSVWYERLIRNQEVAGSNPTPSTCHRLDLAQFKNVFSTWFYSYGFFRQNSLN